jgi:hypothetical protein
LKLEKAELTESVGNILNPEKSGLLIIVWDYKLRFGGKDYWE